MSRKDKYYIDVFNLKNGEHQYEFNIDDEFFGYYENPFTEKGHGRAVVNIDKSEHLITATFDIDVNIELVCDRSLDKFEYHVHQQEKLMFKFGDEEQELDVDLLMITKDTQRINLGQHLFDYIGLSIPYKKLHPRYGDEEDKEQDELIFQTQSDDEEEKDNNAEDPRWDALKKLKGNN